MSAVCGTRVKYTLSIGKRYFRHILLLFSEKWNSACLSHNYLEIKMIVLHFGYRLLGMRLACHYLLVTCSV